MATKSDFAQKLLNDLKLRKERMAAASQLSRHSHSTSRDASSNIGQTYRGSRQNKPLQSVGSKPMNQETRSARSSRSSPDIKESSQVVSYGRNGSSSDYVGDLSMAFAYALQNGKLDFSSKNSSMIDFLHQIGRRSLDMGKMDQRTGSFNKHRSSTSNFPTVSHIHIKEISKGVQNLNQILRACSNGVNFDKYSIEVGKELLKGAKGLEESLRMLVNLQEASDYMVSPQKKNQNRFTLLDDGEEDEDNDVKIAEQRQVDLPRFSFDKRSRSSRGIKEETNQKILALTYSNDPPNLKPHKRSDSYDMDFRTLSTLSDTKSSVSPVQSKSEKGRISNVIAKLMGLEEVQEKVELQSTKKASSSRKKEGSDTNTKNVQSNQSSKREIEKTRIDGKAITQVINIRRTLETADLLKTEKMEVSSRANGGIPDGKLHRKDFERVNVTPAVDKQKSHNDRSNQIPGNGRNGEDNERRHTKHKKQKITEEGLNMEVKQNKKSALVTDTSQEKSEGRKIKLQTEKINEVRVTPNKHRMSPNDQGLLQQHNRKQVSKQELHARTQDKIQVKSKVSSRPATSIQEKQSIRNQVTPGKTSTVDAIPLKELPDDKENEESSRGKSSRDGISNKNESLKELELKLETKQPGNEQPLKPEKPVHVPPPRKKEDSMYKREVPRKIEKVISRRNGALDKLARSSKHQHPLIQELKQRSQERMSSLEGAERVNSKMSNGLDMEIKTEIRPTNEAKLVQQEDENDCQSPKVVHNATSKDNIQKATFEVLSVSNDQTGQAPDCTEDVELMIQDSSKASLAGASEGIVENFHVSKQKHKKVEVILTENEKHLKEILIKGDSFLNIAEALFKLNIPIGNLYAEDHHTRQDWETKLKLDCGNELMRRKARSQELTVHPYMNISISYMKIGSLDDLVKQLYKDFERLTYYGQNENDEVNTAEFLHKMLERDIQSKDYHDINSVWDFGWNEMVFAFVEKEDVTKELEKYLLNGLIDEIAEELLSMTARVCFIDYK